MSLPPNSVTALTPVTNDLVWLVFTGTVHEFVTLVGLAAVTTGTGKDARCDIEPVVLLGDRVLSRTEIIAEYGPDSLKVRQS